MVPYFESTAASKERKAQRTVYSGAATTGGATHEGAAAVRGGRQYSGGSDYNVFQFKAYYRRGSKANGSISTWSAVFFMSICEISA